MVNLQFISRQGWNFNFPSFDLMINVSTPNQPKKYLSFEKNSKPDENFKILDL